MAATSCTDVLCADGYARPRRLAERRGEGTETSVLRGWCGLGCEDGIGRGWGITGDGAIAEASVLERRGICKVEMCLREGFQIGRLCDFMSTLRFRFKVARETI